MKPGQIKKIERIYRRRISNTLIFSPELVRYLSELSWEIGRQIGILVDRRGYIQQVVIGDAHQIFLPQRKRYRSAVGRLAGLRYIHTHLQGELLSGEDLADLSLLRFDCILAIDVGPAGLPTTVHMATLLPGDTSGEPWQIWDPMTPTEHPPIQFDELIRNLEKEFARSTPLSRDIPAEAGKEKALLVSVSTGNSIEAEESLLELSTLARSCGVSIQGSILQRRPSIHPQYVVGKGKLQDLVIHALQSGAEMIIFDHDLSPAQMRSVTNFTELKIIDRTQLILDIFAQRAKTREGKIQVELAQMRYRLPRLMQRDAGLSRLMGGIGGRGPGETKLEIDRRRVRERIQRLEKEINKVRRARKIRKSRRKSSGLPLICLVGYTNAGKSTLFNALTKSRVYTENRLFATLDPATRQLPFTRNRKALITDTVGFIRDLPPDLIAAFRATLEELQDADLLVHVIDSDSTYCEKQLAVVDALLKSLDLDGIPRVSVFNKSDRIDPAELKNLCRRYDALSSCALDPSSLFPLRERMESMLFPSRMVRPVKKRKATGERIHIGG